MGCDQSKPHGLDEASLVSDQGTGGQPASSPVVVKKKHHTDPIVMLCPYFDISPEQFGPWKEHCDDFYKAAMETDDLLCYGMAFNDGGVHVPQGYRSAEALLEHVRRADRPMTEALKQSTLRRVEVYGPRSQLAKVKGQMPKIGDCSFQFFEAYPKMTSIRRPSEFSGHPGSDALVSCHVKVKVAGAAELRGLTLKIRAVHRRARRSTGNESLSMSQCLEQGVLLIAATFDGMEAAVEHVTCIAAHLGTECLHTLEMHGPRTEMAKLGALMRKAGAAGEAAAGRLQEILVAGAKRAAEDAREAKACAEAAALAAAAGVGEAATRVREQMTATAEALQKKAEEMVREVYRGALKAVEPSKDSAKALAEQAYLRGTQAASEVRQAADKAAMKAYELAMATGMAVEQALERASEAAEAAARSVHEELVEVYEAARNAEAAAAQAVGDAGEAIQLKAREASTAAKMAAELGWHAFEWAICEAAKESRRATLRAWDSLKRASEQAVEVLYKKEGEAEAAAEEVVRTAADRARAAGWAVISTSEHVYFAAYQEALAAGMEAEQAKEVAAKSVEAATGKAVAVWRRGEQLATDTAKAAETMASKGEEAIENVWERTTTYVLDTERAFRRSLYKEMVAVQVEVHEATEDVAWAVHYVVAETVEVTHEARDAFLGRIQAWHGSLVEAEVGTLRAVAGAADAEADRAEQKQKACCDVQ